MSLAFPLYDCTREHLPYHGISYGDFIPYRSAV